MHEVDKKIIETISLEVHGVLKTFVLFNDDGARKRLVDIKIRESDRSVFL